MVNGKATNSSIIFKLGEVHADVKSIRVDIEEMKKSQGKLWDYTGSTRTKLDKHLTTTEVKREYKLRNDKRSVAYISILVLGGSAFVTLAIDFAIFLLNLPK